MKDDALLPLVVGTLEEYAMVKPGEAVLCGFSGGADSVTLLSVLHALELPVFACHVNHGIRGEEADRDEAFCREFCRVRNIPLFVQQVDVPTLAREQGVSEETCGRAVRYETFSALSRRVLEEHPEFRAVKTATAHTASDNVETLLFHLARGTGLAGLCGIPPVRGNIIRPLLNCTREDIEAYCERNGLTFVTDSTNEDVYYARNKVRLELLPLFRELNAGADRNMLRTMETLRRDQAYFAERTEELLQQAVLERNPDGEQYSVPVLCAGEDAVLARALSTALTRFAGVQTEQKHTELLLSWLREGRNFGRLDIPGGARVTVTADKLSVCRISARNAQGRDKTEFLFDREIAPNGDVIFTSQTEPTIVVRMRKMTRTELEKGSVVLENTLDYDKIQSNCTVRTRKPGDTFAPKGRGVHKKLKTLYQEAGVPSEERQYRLLIEKEGEVVWLEGFGASDGAAVGPDTTTLWSVEVLR